MGVERNLNRCHFHSHTHTVLSILYPLAARQNKVCLEDKFPVACDHINFLIPWLGTSALRRATNIQPRWGGGGRIEWLNRMDRRWRLCFCRWRVVCIDRRLRDARRAPLPWAGPTGWIGQRRMSDTRDLPCRWGRPPPATLLPSTTPLRSTVLSILYPLAARQNKVCLEDKFPV